MSCTIHEAPTQRALGRQHRQPRPGAIGGGTDLGAAKVQAWSVCCVERLEQEGDHPNRLRMIILMSMSMSMLILMLMLMLMLIMIMIIMQHWIVHVNHLIWMYNFDLIGRIW